MGKLYDLGVVVGREVQNEETTVDTETGEISQSKTAVDSDDEFLKGLEGGAA
jgi:hypothetical protein